MVLSVRERIRIDSGLSLAPEVPIEM